MRIKFKTEEKAGTVKAVTAFLFFPKEIGGEWRWLEHATWEEKYSTCWYSGGWYPTRWL